MLPPLALSVTVNSFTVSVLSLRPPSDMRTAT